MLTKNDFKILAHLRSKGRMPLTQLSKQTGIPISTLFERLKTTAIERHTALLDFHAMGFSTKAIVLLRVAKSHKQDIHTYLTKHFNINNLSKINNGYDYYFECIFRTMNDLETFLETLEEHFPIKARSVHYIVHELKREAFLGDPHTCEFMLEPKIQNLK